MTIRPLTALTLAMLAAAPAQAAVTTTGTLTVSALVVDACVVSATPLAFGSLNSGTATPEVAPANVSVTCTAAKPTVSVTLDGGANAASGVRQMADGSTGRVPYEVYTDAGHASAVAVGGTIYSGAVAAVLPTVIPLYGSVPAGTYAAGAYADAATITVTY